MIGQTAYAKYMLNLPLNKPTSRRTKNCSDEKF